MHYVAKRLGGGVQVAIFGEGCIWRGVHYVPFETFWERGAFGGASAGGVHYVPLRRGAFGGASAGLGALCDKSWRGVHYH